MKKRDLLLAAICAMSIAPAAMAQSFDTIVVHSGLKSVRPGTILEKKMGHDEVVIESSTIETSVPVRNIRRIAFSGEPSGLRAARGFIESGRLEDAQERLEDIPPDSVPRAIVRQEIAFQKALVAAKLAMSGTGEKKDAKDKMLKFVTDNPRTYHYYAAAEILGDLAASMGDYQDAGKYYGAVAAAPWPEYKMRADVLLGEALVAQEKYPEAGRKFTGVLSSPLTTALAERQKLFASLGKAVCLSALKRPEEGIKIIDKIIRNHDPADAELFARTYNALGACHAKAGKPKDAVLAYLHVDIMFYGNAAAHAEALYHLGNLWTKISRSERARAARNTLRTRYPGSVWAAKRD